ncbi:hypothetical protein BH24ACT26_BH24ACT26_07500 [soil metagenome]
MSDQEGTQEIKANDEIASRKRRFSWSAGKWIVVGLVFVAILSGLGAAGVAYATYDYAERYEGRILPSSEIAGVDVSGLTKKRALRAVRGAVRPQLRRRISVRYEGRRWTVTPQKLGARSDARKAVRAALIASGDTTFFDKMKMKMLGHELNFERSVAITYPRQGVRGFVEGIASSVDLEPRDAAIDYSTGWVDFTDDRDGRRVLVDRARKAVMKALRRELPKVSLPVKVLRPEVTSDAFDQVVLVHIGANKLYLYRDGKITHSWTVATGQPEYMTPTGLYEVTEKRYLPTWINPAPTTWGKDMPAEIPPGIANPLGLRAINWSAPAIRFHGTEATYSLGYNASHGCVRMSNSDVIELYDLIEVGTPIVSLTYGSLNPLYVSAPDPTPVADNEASADDEKKGKKANG